MRKELLKYLCCPKCRDDVKLIVVEKKNDDVIRGVLSCDECKSRYPILGGVPVMISSQLLKDFSKTKSNWENWWKKVREKSDIDLYDELWVQAEKNLGGEPLYKKEHFKDKVVLDAGCGTGRYILFRS
ncbi:MAG: hypothetical protein HC945_03360, partial [Nitrosarchaeum sp.]|nr:hypothetical protein [Nitrosarchaeum sp.]